MVAKCLPALEVLAIRAKDPAQKETSEIQKTLATPDPFVILAAPVVTVLLLLSLGIMSSR